MTHDLRLNITNRLQLLLWQSCPFEYKIDFVNDAVDFIMKEFEEVIDRANRAAREICDGNDDVFEGAELGIALVERELRIDHLPTT